MPTLLGLFLEANPFLAKAIGIGRGTAGAGVIQDFFFHGVC